MSKKVLILSGSPRKNGNSDILCDEFAKGATEAGHNVEKILCTLCDFIITKQVCPKILDKPVLFDKLNISNLRYPWAKIFLALHKK